MSSYTPWNDARTLLLAANLIPPEHIGFANEPEVQPPADGAYWMFVEAYSDVLDPVDLGANVWEERGIIVIFCNARWGDGTDGLRQLAKSVANVFRGLGPRNPFYTNGSIGVGSLDDKENYYAIPVTMSFVYQDRTT